MLSPEILSLYQDSKGFLWFGNRSGISRYDGRRFQNLEYAGNKRIGAVYNLAEDADGRLWLSTESGLFYWQEKAFVHYAFSDEAGFLPFSAVHFTAGKQVWLGTAKGPVALSDLHQNGRQSLANGLLKNWRNLTKGDAAVTAISSSKKGVVFGTFASLYLLQNKHLVTLQNNTKGNDYLRNLVMSDDGTVYWNNVATGLHAGDGKTVSVLAANDAFYYDIAVGNGETYVYTNGDIKQINTATKQVKTVVDLFPLEINTPTRLLCDKEGSFWAATTEGVYHIRRNNFTAYKDPRSRYTDVFSLLRRPNGDLLMGANRGKLFLVTDSIRPYQPLPQVVPLAEVFDLHEDSNGLWAATGYQGIALYKNGWLKNFTTKNGLPDNTHHAFFKTASGELWTAGDNGITRISKNKRGLFSFRWFTHPGPTLYHKIYGLMQAPDGSLWAGGQLGLFHLQNDSLRRYALPEMQGQTLHVTAVKMDAQQNVWLATRGHGILLCRFGTDNRLHMRRSWKAEEGIDNTYLSLAFDQRGNVWGGSYSRLTAIMPSAAYSLRNFDAKDGFAQKSYQSLNLFANGDTLWALTSAGAVSFVPASLLAQPYKAPLYITAIDLLNTQKTADDFLERTDGKNRHRFPHDVASFRVQFAALYYSNPGAVRYFYQLQGADSGWTSTGSEPAVLFRQLPPGQYKLLVKAAIGGSNFTNTEAFAFEIMRPWWLQGWAIGLGALAAGGLVLAVIRRREKRLKEREQYNTAIEKVKASSYQYQLEIQRVINYFTASMNKFASVDDMLWDVAKNCIAKLAFEDCVIYLLDEERGVLQQRAAWGPKTTDENKIIHPIEIALGKGIVGAVGLTGKGERINNTAADSRYIVDDAARASEITVPIFDGDRVIGVIDSEHPAPNFYTERHLQILTTIASHCGARISTIKAEQRSAAARLEALLDKQKALEASLQSMRLQMNPHFLFNALNSIQQMILAGEETTATRFLSKFSRLLRTVLTNSARDEVSLKEEMEMLRLYVELESLRFKEAFAYLIDCDESLDPEEVFVPALLFQPLVENAIWHGLMHKEGDRRLCVQFKAVSEACLLCRVEDNGVGRQAAARNGTAQPHTGKGVSVAAERLRVLNEKNGTANLMEIADLKDNAGNAAGTRIDILLYV